MRCIRFWRCSIKREMTGYCGTDGGTSCQTHQSAETDRDAASYIATGIRI